MNTDLLWAIAAMILLGLLKVGLADLNAWRAGKGGQEHPALLPLAAVGADVANAAIAWLSENPAAKASDALAWAVSEWKASAPDLITAAGKAVTDAGLKFAMTRKLLTAAQTSNLSDAAGKVISELAPSAVTARITPTQVATITGTIAEEAPLTLSTLLAKFPGLPALSVPATTFPSEPATVPTPVQAVAPS